MYYPVSALVTLFANILQNPLDPRAKSDLRMMHTVCEFLLAIREEDENGSVSRMLQVCEEFDRIAKVVLEKAEKEASTRRKRKKEAIEDKDKDSDTPKTPLPVGATVSPTADPNYFRRSATAAPATCGNTETTGTEASVPSLATSGPSGSTPVMHQQQLHQHQIQTHDSPMAGFEPSSTAFDTFSPSANFGWLGDVSFPAPTTPKFGLVAPPDAYGGPSGVYQSLNSPPPSMGIGLGGLHQVPYMPQELWQMPMSLEWDWPDLSMGGTSWSTGQNDGT